MRTFKTLLMALSLWVALSTQPLLGPSLGRAAHAQTTNQDVMPALDPAALTAAQKAHIARIEDYFADLKAMAARFLQVSSNGQTARGRFYLWRPGRLRFEYDPPTPILIISNGTWVSYTDNELEQTTLVPVSRTPLSVLVKDPISLASSTEILAIEKAAGVLRIAFRKPDDPDTGTLSLAFTEKPFELKQWTITDVEGAEVRVTLLETVRGEGFDEDLFVVQQPSDIMPTER